MVLVDTPLWSFVLRRRPGGLSSPEQGMVRTFVDLVRQSRVQLLGSTRQEVLSGIRDESQFRRIRTYLRAFPDVRLGFEDHEEAAHASTQCRRVGVSGSPVDMLICAVALRNDWEIFTTDRDFARYRAVLKIRLFASR